MSEWLDCVGCGEIFSDEPPALYCPACFGAMEAETRAEERRILEQTVISYKQMLELLSQEIVDTAKGLSPITTYKQWSDTGANTTVTPNVRWDSNTSPLKFSMSNGVLGHTITSSTT